MTAWLGSPIVGEIPFLDAAIEYEMAQRVGKAKKIQRAEACPPYGEIEIPILRKTIGGVLVPCCSAPIFLTRQESVEYHTKQLEVRHADLLHPKKRHVISRAGFAFKSYRTPLKVQVVDRIVWFVVGKRRTILKLIKSMTSLGQKRGYGYGRVSRWEAEEWPQDWSRFAPSDHGPILMRPLPDCSELPADLLGSRKDFGAVQPPMWHPDRYMERVVPC